MDILKFLVEEALILIPALFILMEIIKRSEVIKNKRWIPVIALVISVAFVPIYLGGFSPENLLQAIFIAGAEVLGYEIFKPREE